MFAFPFPSEDDRQKRIDDKGSTETRLLYIMLAFCSSILVTFSPKKKYFLHKITIKNLFLGPFRVKPKFRDSDSKVLSVFTEILKDEQNYSFFRRLFCVLRELSF